MLGALRRLAVTLAPGGASPQIGPRAAAVSLLQLGTLAMFTLGVVACFVPACRPLLVRYAATILGFIGGMQQAATLADAAGRSDADVDDVRRVAGGIGVAIVAVGVGLLPPRLGLHVLAAAYVSQFLFEQRGPSGVRATMLAAERRASMWLGAVTCAVGAASPLAAALVAATWLCDHDGRTPRKRDPAPKALFRRVAVGSTNPCKNRAVSAAFRDYDFGKPSVHAYEVDSGVSEQPLSLDLTAAGARNRAWRAHSTCVAESGEAALGVGIESGLFSFQGTWFDVCVVSLFDGARHAVGLSCAFEIPPAVARAVFEDGLDLSKAAHAAGLAGRDDIGQDEGLIAILTSDRVNREKYTTQAIQMALVRLEHPLFYLEG